MSFNPAQMIKPAAVIAGFGIIGVSLLGVLNDNPVTWPFGLVIAAVGFGVFLWGWLSPIKPSSSDTDVTP